MKKQIESFKELYIPKPCHQDWDKMTEAEKGKFCASCKKVVFDFTNASAADFNALYALNKGNICGSFDIDQIDQDYAYIANSKVNSKFPSLSKWLSIFVAFIVLKLASIRSSFAQHANALSASSFGNSIKIIIPDPNYRRSEKENSEIKGKVMNQDATSGVVGYDVSLVDANGTLVAKGVSEDCGFFTLKLPDTLNLNQTFTIAASKEKSKTRFRVYKYSGEEKSITEKDFDSVVLTTDSKRRIRRNIIGLRKGGRRRIMGCPKFR